MILESRSQVNIGGEREELLQRFMENMFLLIRQMHKDAAPQEHLLSPPQASLAFTIAKYKDEGISVNELAKIAEITPGAITQFTKVLINKNLVTREVDPSDRRIIRLKITPYAKNKMEIIKKAFLTAATRRLTVLNIEELKQLDNLLAKINSEPAVKDNVR